MQRRPLNDSQSANATATMELVEQESGEDHPGGQRFTSLQQTLQYAQNNKARSRLAADIGQL